MQINNCGPRRLVYSIFVIPRRAIKERRRKSPSTSNKKRFAQAAKDQRLADEKSGQEFYNEDSS